MKKAVIGFLCGVLVASAGWYAYTWYLQSVHAVEYCGFLAGQAEFSEKLLAQADSPSEETRHRTQRTAVRMIEGWLFFVDDTDRKYPFTRVRERCASQYAHAAALVEEWKRQSNAGER
ncbi:MAG: hypothetical protein H0X66_15160 [Verrucomicrobia bacterium]|nr:hypothetical protein [Verrucomicrobiota bacterium]